MNHLHPGFALVLLLEAFLVLLVLRRWILIEPISGHAPTIDGLKGFLAFGVFVHHASIWYSFLKTGAWVVPESRLYTHLGQTTVALFFMITGFLFYNKILESQSKPIDWLRLYVSRCLRILPLYLLVMLVGALVIALIRHSGWVSPMEAPWSEKSLTGLFTAGVTWTLAYEWKFYYALPFLALTVGRVSWKWLVFSAVMLLILGITKALDIYACAFVGGITAASLAKLPWWVRLSSSGWGSALAVGPLLWAVSGFDTAYSPEPLLLLAISFALMASGADLWGLLTANWSRAFGEMTYSVYLLHGPLLFIAFRFVFGFRTVEQLSPIQYWGAVALLVPVLLGLSAVSFKYFEQRFMRKTTEWTSRLRLLTLHVASR
jgi:peptidoglycan/LPS O-acetylase OafA/YrhL